MRANYPITELARFTVTGCAGEETAGWFVKWMQTGGNDATFGKGKNREIRKGK